MAKTIAPPSVSEEWKREANFQFGGKLKEPKGFDEMQIGKKVTLTITSSISRLSQDKSGSSMTVFMDSVVIERRSKLRPA